MSSLAQIEGKYEILEKLHDGGMGSIYRVRHRLLEEHRVVKVLRRQLAEDPQFRSRFLQEAQLAATLKHPNIAQIHDFTVDEAGTGFIVMEFIDGVSLKEILAASGPPSLPASLEIARQGLRALGFLHRKGYVHRDISPDNVMVAADVDGQLEIKLIDLGIAKKLGMSQSLTTTGHFLGKLRYSSPEHFGERGAAGADARSDVYGFGLVLYELLTGEWAVMGNDLPSLSAGHLLRPPKPFTESDPNGRVPDALRVQVMRALEKNPNRRFDDAEAFAASVASLIDEHPLPPDFSVTTLVEPARARRHETAAHAPGSTQVHLDRHFGVETTPGGSRTPAFDFRPAAETATDVRTVAIDAPGLDPAVTQLIPTVPSPASAAPDDEPSPGSPAHDPATADTASSSATSTDSPSDGGEKPAQTTRLLGPDVLSSWQKHVPPSERQAPSLDARSASVPSGPDDAPELPNVGAPASASEPPTPVASVPEEPQAPPAQERETPTRPVDPAVLDAASREGARRDDAPKAESPSAAARSDQRPSQRPAGTAKAAKSTVARTAAPPVADQLASAARQAPKGSTDGRSPLVERWGRLVAGLRTSRFPAATRNRPVAIAAGLAALVVVALLIGLLRRGSDPEPDAVAEVTPPPAAPPRLVEPTPPTMPDSGFVVEPAPDVHPELIAARACLAEGDLTCTREALAVLAAIPADLTPAEREERAELEAQVATLEAAKSESAGDLDAMAQQLIASLVDGPIADLRDAVDALNQLRRESPDDWAALDPEILTAFAEGDKIIIEYRRMWRLKNDNDHWAVIPQTGKVAALFPPYQRFADEHRDTAAAAIENEAYTQESAGDVAAALATVRGLQDIYPDREGLAHQIASFEHQLKQSAVDPELEALLAVADTVAKGNDPEPMIERLAAVSLPDDSPYVERLAAARQALDDRLEALDRSPPEVTLAPGQPMEYKRKQPISIAFTAVDAYRLESVTAYVRAGTSGPFAPIPLRAREDTVYLLEITAEAHGGSREVQIYVEARDPAGHLGRLGSPDVPLTLRRKSLLGF